MSYSCGLIGYNVLNVGFVSPFPLSANVKQVLTILCAVLMFNLNITMLNSLGIALTLIGGALYARVEYMEKQEKQKNNRGPI